nr:hypothetical protein [Gulosibacter chungangensis]
MRKIIHIGGAIFAVWMRVIGITILRWSDATRESAGAISDLQESTHPDRHFVFVDSRDLPGYRVDEDALKEGSIARELASLFNTHWLRPVQECGPMPVCTPAGALCSGPALVGIARSGFLGSLLDHAFCIQQRKCGHSYAHGRLYP